ncbi:MAG: hypothetical protein WCF24_01475 [Acidimicrobiales bacterium]
MFSARGVVQILARYDKAEAFRRGFGRDVALRRGDTRIHSPVSGLKRR